MNYINAHFKEVEERLGFPKEAIEAFEKVATKIGKSKSFSKKFDAIYNKYMKPEAHDFGKCMDELNKLSIFRGVNRWTMQMVFLIIAAEEMHNIYKERNLSDELFWETLQDLKYKYKECVDCKESHGTFVGGWDTGFYNLTRFKLGRYQYDMTTYGGEDFTSSAGITIKKGDKTLGFHIPSSGVSLTDEVRLDSFKKAYEFFPEYRREDGLMIFECGSWLIYEEYKNFLPENSNIIKFINDFEIVSSESRDKFNDAWRIFNKSGYKSPKKWDENTSMQRAFKKHVLSGGKTGHGHGIIVFDGKKIVR